MVIQTREEIEKILDCGSITYRLNDLWDRTFSKGEDGEYLETDHQRNSNNIVPTVEVDFAKIVKEVVGKDVFVL